MNECGGDDNPAMTTLPHGTTHLSQYGVIRAEGDDAASFLHGQLTQDFLLLGTDQARLAAYCSAKGRMLASFLAFKRTPTEILLVCRRDVLVQTLKRLSMFVLRAKVKLSDASDQFQLYGLIGSPVDTFGLAGASLWAVKVVQGATAIRVHPAQGAKRALVLTGTEGMPMSGDAISEAIWDWAEVLSGVAMISAPVVELFVPQMLNYESVGGVNFKKGCYPGQEVVARSQFRGTLKRRAYIVHADKPLTVGAEVYHSSDASQPIGTVAAAAANPGGGWEGIACLQTSAAGQGTLHLGSPDGNPVTLCRLPYFLVEDV